MTSLRRLLKTPMPQEPQRTPLTLRDGGDLRTGQGGHVPGSGNRDTIPAKYTPGEFVVSNAMLDAAPGLRDQLRDLRGNVLAAKGVTPEQADADALSYDGSPSGGQNGQQTGLRQTGAAGDRRGGEGASLRDAGSEAGAQGWLAGQERGARTGLRGELDGPRGVGRGAAADLVRGVLGARRDQVTLRAAGGFGFDPSKYTPPKVDPKTGTYAAGAAPAQPTAAPAGPAASAASPETTAPKPGLREGMQAQQGVFNKAKYAATSGAQAAWGGVSNAVGTTFRAAKSFGPGLAAGAAGGYAAQQARSLGEAPAGEPRGNYRPPSAASQVPGYDRMKAPAPSNQPYNWFTDSDTGRNIGNNLVAAGPLGGMVGTGLRALGVAGKAVPRIAAFADLADAAGVGAAGNIMSGRLAAASENSSSAATNSVAPTLRSPGDATMPGQDPGRVTLRGMAGTDMGSGISKFTQGGKTLYSNVPGADNDKLMSNRPGVSIVPGMSQDTVNATLRNPDGSRWSAGDNATMAANLRDGIDPYAGTLRGQAKPQFINAYKAQTERRGQDITERDNIRTNDTSLRNARATNMLGMYNAQREQGNANRTYTAGREDADFAQNQAAQKAVTDEIASYLPPGSDGKPDTAAAAQHMGSLNAMVSSRMQQLEQHIRLNPGDKGAAGELEGLRRRGVAQLDAETKRKFVTGVSARNAVNDSTTGFLNPVGTTSTNTTLPVTSLRKQAGTFGHDYVTNTGDVVPGRFIDRSGSFAGLGGKKNHEFDDLIKQGERESTQLRK